MRTDEQISNGDGHYDAVAADYEKAFFYSSVQYRDWVLQHLLSHFKLPDHVGGAAQTSSHITNKGAQLVDIGGGTGNFTQALAEASQAQRRVLCVDPFKEMLHQAARHERVEPFLMGAVEFAQLPPSQMSYTHALLKEVVHHIPSHQMSSLFLGLAAQLQPGGVVVVITRPQEVDYPLFKRAREIWREHQPPHTLYTRAMQQAGLEVEVCPHHYPATLPLSTWLGMMRDKFWSTFSHCTPEELAQGIAEVEAEHAGQESVRFVDRLLFLVGRKRADPHRAHPAPAPDGRAAVPSNPAGTGEEARTAGTAGTAGTADTAGTAGGGTALGSNRDSMAGLEGGGPGPGPVRGSVQSGRQGGGPRGGKGVERCIGGGVLSAEQVKQYRRDGFTGPVTVLQDTDAAEVYSRFQEYEAGLGGRVEGSWRFKAHLLLPWMWDLVHHPRVVGAVRQALGGCRNLLCWSTDIFCKEGGGGGGFTSWHQDSTYVGLEPPDVVTAWFALTPSLPSNGCLRFLPGSHHSQLPHQDTYASGNMLLKGQAIQELEARGEEGVTVQLLPGQMSLHHIRMAHCSRPAEEGAGRRVGIAIRYMAAHVHQELNPRDSVTVVAGQDTFGMYRHESRPKGTCDAAAQQEHSMAVGRVYPDDYSPHRQ